jgi:hypothetical protein
MLRARGQTSGASAGPATSHPGGHSELSNSHGQKRGASPGVVRPSSSTDVDGAGALTCWLVEAVDSASGVSCVRGREEDRSQD